MKYFFYNKYKKIKEMFIFIKWEMKECFCLYINEINCKLILMSELFDEWCKKSFWKKDVKLWEVWKLFKVVLDW